MNPAEVRSDSLEWRLPAAMRVAYASCAAIALFVIWVFKYHAGIDLAQHANFFQMLARYGDPKSGFRFFYYVDFFTPYAALYLLGWPLTKIGGAVFAVKVVLSIAALATPLTLGRWLRAVGGEPWLALLGFPLVFGFPYLWGFLSMVLATPVSFAYLAAFEEFRREHRPKRMIVASALGILLFFCHGVTFGVTMLASGLICALQTKWRRILVEGLHFVPIVLVFVPWLFLHHGHGGMDPKEWPTESRFVTLFSGQFSPQPAYFPALAGFAVFASLVIAGRPTLATTPSRLVPVTLAVAGLLGLPEWLHDTWLIGSRFVHYVYCFLPAAFDVTLGQRGLRRFRTFVAGLSALGLLTFGYRLKRYNAEYAGFSAIQHAIPPGGDVKLFIGQVETETFGDSELSQSPAWITAEQGGFLENDLSQYFQLPLQRRSQVPRPLEYTYFVTRGTARQARNAVGHDATLLLSDGRWHVFEGRHTKVDVPGLTLVRFGQDWKVPRQDLAVQGEPLTIAGRGFLRGIGTHARSALQMRLTRPARRLRGMVGMDDEATESAEAVFRIMNWKRERLWSSPKLGHGDAPVAFDVSIEGIEGDVFLVTDSVGPNTGAHTDWVDVEAVP
jgi:hypothetical protein